MFLPDKSYNYTYYHKFPGSATGKPTFFPGKKAKPPPIAQQRFYAAQTCKPGSVLTAIYLAPELLPGSSRLLGTVGPTIYPSTALLRDRVYSTPMSPWGGCALTAPFHYDQKWLHLSVALVLRSPSAGVTRYPCPVEPGLSSSAAFRPASAAVRPGCGNIVLHPGPIVKLYCKFFREIVYYTYLSEIEAWI